MKLYAKMLGMVVILSGVSLFSMEQPAVKPYEGVDLDSQLFGVVETGGSLEEVKNLLRAGANVNAVNKETGEPILNWAILLNREDIVKFLIEMKADVNATNLDGRTALMKAIFRKNLKIAKMLIEAGANVNAKSRNGNTALIEASLHDAQEIAELLIANGAEVNVKVKESQSTALMVAAENANNNIAKLLVENGADILAKDRWGLTALDIAKMQGKPPSEGGNLELVNFFEDVIKKRIMQAVAVGMKDLDTAGMTEEKKEKELRDLRDKALAAVMVYIANLGGAILEDLVDDEKTGNTPLHIALLMGNFDLAKYIASINPLLLATKNNKGKTALEVGIGLHKDKPQFWDIMVGFGKLTKPKQK